MKIDEKEFEQLVKKHKNTIYTVCFMFSKDSEEVNDLFQEVLIAIWQGLPTFKGQSNIATWIWRISLNTCISCERKKKKNVTVPLSMDVDYFEDKDADAQQVRMLYERVHQLKPFDRAIVLLWLEGIPYDEIAAIVGITTSNVATRLFRIREQLKQMSNHETK
ncbi:MAG: sigma-70 family RNA polymerase sigma factor [Bacteroidales bacterium]|nr:sigma-70 family RNA polymerase sigma factor [Bacteroidales bacterium]